MQSTVKKHLETRAITGVSQDKYYYIIFMLICHYAYAISGHKKTANWRTYFQACYW
jgi:hypothetical protein